jgi:ADP-ribose pyrophosphatase YjhB (NUDIX family)
MQSIKMNRPFLAVRAIITNEVGKMLILRRSNTIQGNGKWCLPGGNIEYGQTTLEAVASEIKQETSLAVRDVKFLFYLENLPSEESELHYINLVFKCLTEGNLLLNHESSEYAWIGPGEIHIYDFAFKNDKMLDTYWDLYT